MNAARPESGQPESGQPESGQPESGQRLERFSRDGLTFEVRDQGPLQGRIVLLLHGFPQDGSAFDSVLPLLHEAGLRTLVPELRGYSPQARPVARRDYRINESVLDMVALLDAVFELGTDGIGVAAGPVHVVGHDWGGAVAWALAGRRPQRVRSLVVLSTPHPAAMTHAITHGGQGLRSWYMLWFQVPRLPELGLRGRLGAMLLRTGLPADQAARYTARMAEPGALRAALGWYRALPWSLRESIGSLEGADLPVTYVWGRKDFALGRAAAEQTREFAGPRYRFVELDAGHWLPETRAVPVATVILDQVRALGDTAPIEN